VHGCPVFFAISGFAMVCRDAIIIIALAIKITVAIRVAPVKPRRIVLRFSIADLLTVAPCLMPESRTASLASIRLPENADQCS
jgi:hypothetical protein